MRDARSVDPEVRGNDSLGILIAAPQISGQLGIFKREDGMAASLSMTRAAAVVALLALGCAKKDPDPTHFKLADFDSDKQLEATLKGRIRNSPREAAVWEMMQGNGFRCAERAGILVDLETGKIGTGKPDLNCFQSTPIHFGLRRRAWTVLFTLDSARVTDVYVRSMKQDL